MLHVARAAADVAGVTRIRHLLGDPSVLERLLRRACTEWRPA